MLSDKWDLDRFYELSNWSTDQLTSLVDTGSDTDRKRAILRLGERGDAVSNDTLLDYLRSENEGMQEGAGLVLSDRGDLRAIPYLQTIITDLLPQDIETNAFVGSFVRLIHDDIEGYIDDLVAIIQQGSYLSAVEAASAIADTWDQLSASAHHELEIRLSGILSDGSQEDWRQGFVRTVLCVS